jgi:hypothetical protein
MHLERLARLGISGVEAKVFDVNERLGAISRAPLAT